MIGFKNPAIECGSVGGAADKEDRRVFRKITETHIKKVGYRRRGK
jgi:hypothetical protein